MALLLNIDTATEVASVCLSLNGSSLAYNENRQQREHASFVHKAVESVLQQAGVHLKDVDAFAVTSGPGSYTGLRVGMATVKGFCYAFNKPLININTLEVMAAAALSTIELTAQDVLLAPMIDARRMEVFTALYNTALENILPAQPMILDERSFERYLTDRKVVFLGSGSEKFKAVNSSDNSVFVQVEHSAKNLATLAYSAFQVKKFADVSYSEPNYFKDFHALSKR